MTRVLTLLLLAIAALAGCSSGSGEPVAEDASAGVDEGQHRIVASDESFTIDVPEDWATQEQYLQDPVVVAVQGQDEVNQLLVSVFDDPGAAEDQAIYTATGLADNGIFCKRLEDSTAFGDSRLVLDCPQKADGATVRKLFLPIEHDGGSILVFVQTAGETLAETATFVRPMLDSLTWK